MRDTHRTSKSKWSPALYLAFVVSLLLVALSVLPHSGLVPELSELGGPLLAVSIFTCLLSWCFLAFSGFAIATGRPLRWAATRFAVLILLPVLGAVVAFEVYVDGAQSGENGLRKIRFAMTDFDGAKFERRWHEVDKNAQGWRSSRDYRSVSQDETLSFLIGDSFVFGAVGQEDTIDAILLDRHLGPRHVIYNFGRAGTGLEAYLAVAEAYRHLEPRNVLVFIYVGNDIPTRRHRSPWPRACSMCDSLRDLAGRVTLFRRLGHQLEKNAEMSKVRPETVAALARQGIAPREVNPFYLAWVYPKSPDTGLSATFIADMAAEFEASPALQASLRAIADRFTGTNFCYVLLPMHFQVSQRYIDIEAAFHLPIRAPLDREIQDALLAWAERAGVCMIDLLPAMQDRQARSEELLFYPLDGHLRPAGNAFVAETLRGLGLPEGG